MKKCPNCGKTAFSNATVCKKCGASFTENSDITGTIQGGIEAMDEGDFPLATYRWRAAVAAEGNPSDTDYREMLKATSRCIIGQVSKTDYQSREGMSDLAIVLTERRFMEDVMYTLGSALPMMASKAQLSKLGAEYMYIAFESFNSYPDLNYMVHLMRVAHETMSKFQEAFPDLQGEDKGQSREFRFYVEYTEHIADAMENRIFAVGSVDMELAVDYWREHSIREYGDKAILAARAASKMYMTREVRSLHVKSRDNKVNAFLDAYFDGPSKSLGKKRKF